MRPERHQQLVAFLRSLGLECGDRDLTPIEEALTHTSAGRAHNHERLEFLGDAVLRLAAWDWGLIIVTPNPLTYALFPLVVLARWGYLGLFSRPSSSSSAPTPPA